MSRPTTAHIRLDAFRHNYQLAKQMHGGKALAVIKANAYGHGALQCAKAVANEADGFAVACLEEALLLRQASISNAILLLEGFFESAELPEIVANDLWIVVHAQWQVDILLTSKLAKPLHIWLKLDSGMHRLGFSPSDYLQAYAQLNHHPNVAKITLMSHFANADDLTSLRPVTSLQTGEMVRPLKSPQPMQQISVFQATIASLNTLETSLANSAAILGWPKSMRNWSRPGIMLYGANPLQANSTSVEITGQVSDPKMNALRPVMQLTSTIISIRCIKKGEAIGYGSLFTATRDTVVGVVACGYADGYPRSAGSHGIATPVAVDGQLTQIIGRVSMDMLMVDLTEIANVRIGSKVELWGDQISANKVAEAAGTIAYELFCNVKRVQFKYTDS